MKICTRDCDMPRKDFLKQFPGNETNTEWASSFSSQKPTGASALPNVQEMTFRACRDAFPFRDATDLTISELKDIHRRISIGEAKARRAKERNGGS